MNGDPYEDLLVVELANVLAARPSGCSNTILLGLLGYSEAVVEELERDGTILRRGSNDGDG